MLLHGSRQLRSWLILDVSQKNMPTEDIVSFLRQHAGSINGTLCVFGDWFGRPMDNWHQVTTHEAQKDYLKFVFTEGETLEVWCPKGLKKKGNRFYIEHAARVRWEWFYYGRPKLPENRFFREHVTKDGVIKTESNEPLGASFKPTRSESAVSIT